MNSRNNDGNGRCDDDGDGWRNGDGDGEATKSMDSATAMATAMDGATATRWQQKAQWQCDGNNVDGLHGRNGDGRRDGDGDGRRNCYVLEYFGTYFGYLPKKYFLTQR